MILDKEFNMLSNKYMLILIGKEIVLSHKINKIKLNILLLPKRMWRITGQVKIFVKFFFLSIQWFSTDIISKKSCILILDLTTFY